MKSYEVQSRLSGGSVACDRLEAKSVEDVKRTVFARLPNAQDSLSQLYSGERLEEVEIYELVRVATIDLRPRVVS